MGHQLQSLALIPESLGRLGHRRLQQASHHQALFAADRLRRGNRGALLFRKDRATHLRVKIALAMFQLLLQMPARKLQGDKLVALIRQTRGAERLISHGIIARHVRQIIALQPLAQPDGALPAQVQAKLHAPRMKTLAPVEHPVRAKIVPLHTDTRFFDVPVKRTPTVRNLAPRRLLACRHHVARHAP